MFKILEKLYPSTLYDSFSSRAGGDLNQNRLTKETIFAEKIGNLFGSNPRTEIEEALTAVGVVILPQSGIPWPYRLGWLSVILTWIVIRTIFAEIYKRSDIKIEHQLNWGILYTICDFISALLWSALLIYSAFNASETYTAILKVIFVAFVTNVVAGLYAFFPATSIVFTLTMISAMIVTFLIEITPLNLAAVVFLLFYIYVVIGLGKNTELRYNRLQSLRMELETKKNEAEKASIAKTRFLAAASHDLRQPLHALSLFSELLEEEAKNAKTQATVKNIQGSIHSLEELLNSILDISKLDASVITPEYSAFHLRDLLRILEVEFSAIADQKGLDFSIEKPDLIVKSDFTLLGRILRNLINNAVIYTDSGSIIVTARIEGQYIKIMVKDSGIGINKEHQKSVFEEFFQIDNPQRIREKGLGLGLAIVRRLADLLRHTIELESMPNQGTVFTVSVPLGSAQNIIPPKLEPKPASSETLDTNVWVIEDDSQIAEAQKSLLSKWGCQCHLFSNKASVYQALETGQKKPNAILADFKLEQGTNGAKLIKLIRSHFSQDIPALIITGDTAPEQLIEIESYGFKVIHKPAKPSVLKSFLASINK